MQKRGTCSKQKNKVKLQNMFKGAECVIYLTEFKIKVIQMFTKARRKMHEHSENFNKDKKNCKKVPNRKQS